MSAMEDNDPYHSFLGVQSVRAPRPHAKSGCPKRSLFENLGVQNVLSSKSGCPKRSLVTVPFVHVCCRHSLSNLVTCHLTLLFSAQMAYICEKCVSVYSSSQALAKHKRKGKCVQVFCNACQMSVPKRQIKQHLKNSHPELVDMAKSWHIMKDCSSAAHQKDLSSRSSFHVQWLMKRTMDDAEKVDRGVLALQDIPGRDEPARVDPVHEHPADSEYEYVTEEEDIDVPQGVRVEGTSAGHEPSDMALRVGQITRREIVESEQRVCRYMYGFAVSFNNILKTGVGEVEAVDEVSLLDFVEDFNPRVHGSKFPQHLCATNFDIDLFELTTSEFRGLEVKTVNNTLRDVRRFFRLLLVP